MCFSGGAAGVTGTVVLAEPLDLIGATSFAAATGPPVLARDKVCTVPGVRESIRDEIDEGCALVASVETE